MTDIAALQAGRLEWREYDFNGCNHSASGKHDSDPETAPNTVTNTCDKLLPCALLRTLGGLCQVVLLAQNRPTISHPPFTVQCIVEPFQAHHNESPSTLHGASNSDVLSVRNSASLHITRTFLCIYILMLSWRAPFEIHDCCATITLLRQAWLRQNGNIVHFKYLLHCKRGFTQNCCRNHQEQAHSTHQCSDHAGKILVAKATKIVQTWLDILTLVKAGAHAMR
ncbi:hypothetical protein K439DRAFT_1616248 [Ramaria rubella]|nr:hypothetical protein K439DRAFT_1616248 [Ramaria rubella]